MRKYQFLPVFSKNEYLKLSIAILCVRDTAGLGRRTGGPPFCDSYNEEQRNA